MLTSTIVLLKISQDMTHAKLPILLVKSCIPSILIDSESMEFSTIERYQIWEFGSIIICTDILRCPSGSYAISWSE